MSVMPSSSTSPSALFPGLFAASGSNAEPVDLHQAPPNKQHACDETHTFDDVLQQNQQQFANPAPPANSPPVAPPNAFDPNGDKLPTVAFDDLAGQLVEGPLPIPGSDLETETETDAVAFPFSSLFTLVGSGFELPVDSVETEPQLDDSQQSGIDQIIELSSGQTDDSDSPSDTDSDSGDPVALQPELDTDEDRLRHGPPFAPPIPVHAHPAPTGTAIDNTATDSTAADSNLGNEAVDPNSAVGGLLNSDTTSATEAAQALKDLRTELEDQFGVRPNRRRFSPDGLQPRSTTAELANGGGIASGNLTSEFGQPRNPASLMSFPADAIPGTSVSASEASNLLSALPTSQSQNSQPVTSGVDANVTGVGNFEANAQQQPMALPTAFDPASISNRQPRFEQNHPPVDPIVPLPVAEASAQSTTRGTVDQAAFADDPQSQLTSAVAGKVAESDRAVNQEESELQSDLETEQDVAESAIDSSHIEEVSTTRQQPKKLPERNGGHLPPTSADASDGFSILDKPPGLAPEPVKPSPQLLPDPTQAVDADLDLLQQLLPRDSSASSQNTTVSNLADANTLTQLETLNLPRQIATRALSEAEVLESGDSSHFRMKLDPPELGSVMIEMQKSILGTTITVTAADPATQQLLQDSLQNLNQNEAGETGLFDNLTFDLATGDQGQQQNQQDDERSDSRVVRIAENRPASKQSNTHSDTTSEVDFVA